MKNAYAILAGSLLVLLTGPAHAVDSYRFFHVTIETPWMIFIFLLLIILVPFILTAVLHWYYAGRGDEAESKSNNTD